MKSCRWQGFSKISLAIRPYHPSLPAGLPGNILCPYRAVVRGSLNTFPDFFRMGFSKISLAIRPYHPSLPEGLPGNILCPYRAVVRGSLNKFPDFFVWLLLLRVHTWNSCPFRSNILRLQCTCCTVPTTSGEPHRILLVWACQWPSSQHLSSPQLSHNDSLWA